ncbi:MAG: fatty acid desaturase, partial [Burkholderiales bacterium]
MQRDPGATAGGLPEESFAMPQASCELAPPVSGGSAPDTLGKAPPSRRELRAALAPFAAKSTPIALAWTALDLVLFAAGLAAIAAPTPVLLKLALAPALAIVIARLFIIGHDACHQSLTGHRALNRVLGRAVFLPSLTPYSLWEVGHNLAHHGFSNLRGKDSVWVPFSPEEYARLSPARRLLERLYRGGYGHGLYYLVELWWKKLYFPSAAQIGAQRPVFVRDGLLVTAFALLWVGGLATAAQFTGQSALLLVALGFALPFALWNALMGFVIYLHHTDPQVAWYDNAEEWAANQPYLTTTIHAEVPIIGGWLLHNIMHHPAHHLDMGIPFYR